MPTQLDIITHSPSAMARAYRIAAETERHNPYFPPAERAQRADAHLAEAERWERIADENRRRVTVDGATQ